MNVTAESYGHAVILNLKGELIEDSLNALRQAVDRYLTSGDKEVVDLVLNLENVPFIDSSVLTYLLDLRDFLSERLGQVKLVKCDQNVRKILEITRLDADFELFEDVPEATKMTQA